MASLAANDVATSASPEYGRLASIPHGGGVGFCHPATIGLGVWPYGLLDVHRIQRSRRLGEGRSGTTVATTWAAAGARATAEMALQGTAGRTRGCFRFTGARRARW